MRERCEACGGAIAGEEPRCPHCGIRFLTEADGAPAPGSGGAPAKGAVDPLGLVPDGLAGPPLPVPDAGPEPGAEPAAPIRWKRWLLVAAGITVLGAAAGLAVRRMVGGPLRARGR